MQYQKRRGNNRREAIGEKSTSERRHKRRQDNIRSIRQNKKYIEEKIRGVISQK